MGMSYTQVEVSHYLIRDELLNYLQDNLRSLRLPEPVSTVPNTVQHWFDRTQRAGVSVNCIASDVVKRLISSGRAHCTTVEVGDSSVMSAHNAYQPLRAKIAVLEEITELVRMGVLMPVGLNPTEPGLNYDFKLDVAANSVMVTEYGLRYLADAAAVPYFAEAYLEQLTQTTEADEDLTGYLSEGLACLRSHLVRAAAILLRLAAEHSLNRLIQSTEASLSQDKERERFTSRIRRAGIRIEERAEVVFRKLESSGTLIPDTKQSRNAVRNRLRPAFHSIRDLGGRAAHTASRITLEEVTDHYTLYVYSVHRIIAMIIEHQGAV